MPVETRFDPVENLTVHTCSGRLQRGEILTALDDFHGDPDQPDRVLWDLSRATDADLSVADVVDIAEYPRRFLDLGLLTDGKRAILNPSGRTLPLVRMVDAYRKLAAEHEGYETREFRDRNSALNWLRT